MMDDLISRKAVLKAINNMVKECDSVYVTSALRNLEVIVADLPFAQPERTEYIPDTKAVPSKRDCVDLAERVTATFYDQEHEEWTQKSVTIADVLDSVCDDYTILPSTYPDLSEYSDKLFAMLQRACKHRCLSMDRYGRDSELHPTCHHEIYADVSWGECVEGKCPLLNPHKEERRTDEKENI